MLSNSFQLWYLPSVLLFLFILLVPLCLCTLLRFLWHDCASLSHTLNFSLFLFVSHSDSSHTLCQHTRTFLGWGWDWEVVPACSVPCKQRTSVSNLMHVNSQGEKPAKARRHTVRERDGWRGRRRGRGRKRKKERLKEREWWTQEIPSALCYSRLTSTLLYPIEQEGAQVGLWHTYAGNACKRASVHRGEKCIHISIQIKKSHFPQSDLMYIALSLSGLRALPSFQVCLVFWGPQSYFVLKHCIFRTDKHCHIWNLKSFYNSFAFFGISLQQTGLFLDFRQAVIFLSC